jgi:hypothetical protein
MRQLLLVFVGFVLGYLIFNRGCSSIMNNNKYDTLKIEIDTLVVKKDTTIYKQGKDIFHEKIVLDSVFADKLVFDTLYIVQDYHAVNRYVDTLDLPDSVGYVIITDTITQNQLKGRSFVAQVSEKTIKERIVLKEKPKGHLYAGYAYSNGSNLALIYQSNKNINYIVGGSKNGLLLGITFRIK